MNKETARLLLECYRPQDASDPIFAEALRQVVSDPELSDWFSEMRRFDELMAAKLKEESVPSSLKRQILLGYRPPQDNTSRRFSPWMIPSSIAALLLAGLFSWYLLAPRQRPINTLAVQAISYTTRMPPLQFVCFDAAAVTGWINAQSGSKQLKLELPKPNPSLSMAMIGSSVVEWNGHPVVMICLQDGKRMAMLYILKDAGEAGLPEGGSETVQQKDWVVRATRANGQVRLLTTKGRPEDLDFETPL